MSYQFHGQRASEDVLLVSKQHPFILLHPFFISVLLLLVPFAVYIVMPLGTFFAIILVLCVILAIVHGVLAWYAWSRTLFLLTNERVVFLHQKSLLQREFVECTLPSVQQVSHEVKGLSHTIFGYGTIIVTTGGAHAPIMLKDIPDPYELQQEIQRAANGEQYLEN